MQPKILILDEPTSQRNPTAASDFFAVLKNPYRGVDPAEGKPKQRRFIPVRKSIDGAVRPFSP